MSEKEMKDAAAFDDVHVGKPDYNDFNDPITNVETYSGETVVGHTALKRGLKPRHIAMISIGGVIGTGLFVSALLCLSFPPCPL